MTIFDIAVCVLAVLAVIDGWRRGFALQAFGLVAIVVGIFVAVRTGAEAGAKLPVDAQYAAPAGFFLVFMVVAIGLLLVGRVFRTLFKAAGLGMFDTLFGVIVSLLKVALVLGIMCAVFDRFNEGAHFVDRASLDRSLFYRPLCNVVDGVGMVAKSLEQGTEQVVEQAIQSI